MTVREVPDELHSWLKQQAEMHHRSVNKEVIAQLEKLMGKTEEIAESTAAERFAAMMENE